VGMNRTSKCGQQYGSLTERLQMRSLDRLYVYTEIGRACTILTLENDEPPLIKLGVLANQTLQTRVSWQYVAYQTSSQLL
jgi:hypothetical protein